MNAVNFSANGTRWRALAITSEDLTKEHVPPLPGTGLLFSSADGDMRFLPLDAGEVPSSESLRGKTVGELGTLAQLAKPMAR